MKTASRFVAVAALLVALLPPALSPVLSPALAAPHHTSAYRPYAHWPHAPVRITIHPARIDFDRYIDPISGMYCRNTGWAAVCVPPPLYTRGLDCAPAWPFAACRSF